MHKLYLLQIYLQFPNHHIPVLAAWFAILFLLAWFSVLPDILWKPLLHYSGPKSKNNSVSLPDRLPRMVFSSHICVPSRSLQSLHLLPSSFSAAFVYRADSCINQTFPIGHRPQQIFPVSLCLRINSTATAPTIKINKNKTTSLTDPLSLHLWLSALLQAASSKYVCPSLSLTLITLWRPHCSFAGPRVEETDCPIKGLIYLHCFDKHLHSDESVGIFKLLDFPSFKRTRWEGQSVSRLLGGSSGKHLPANARRCRNSGFQS